MTYVRIDTPFRIWYDDMSWLLERCDSVLPERVCACLNEAQASDLVRQLSVKGMESTILEGKPTPKPLPNFVRLILAAWYRDQQEEWRKWGGSY